MKGESSKKEKKRYVRRVGRKKAEDLGPKENVSPEVTTPDLLLEVNQGGHDTGKTGNLVLTFSRQGKHRKFVVSKESF